MNIPNILSVIRLFLVPVFIIAFIVEGEPKTLSAAIFIAAGLTDVLDGYIARKFNMTSKVGQLLDPLADKLMQIAVVVSMLCAKMVPLWFVLILAIKEFSMIVASFFLYTKKTFVKSNIFGKVNTVVVFCTLIILLVFSETNPSLKGYMLDAVIVTSALAIFSYIYVYFIKHKQFKKYIGKNDTEDLAQ